LPVLHRSEKGYIDSASHTQKGAPRQGGAPSLVTLNFF